MVKLFTFLGYLTQAKKAYEKPQELLSDISFGIIQGYFIISFIVFTLFSGLSIWFGFFKGILFFQFTSVVFVMALVTSIVVYLKLKRFVEIISNNITRNFKKRIPKNHHRVIDVDSEAKKTE